MEKRCGNSVSNDALIDGGKLTVIRNAISPFQNDPPNNEGVKEPRKSHVECSIGSVQPISCLLSLLNWGFSFLVCVISWYFKIFLKKINLKFSLCSLY